MRRPLSTRRLRVAWIVAVAADLLQIILFPILAEGLASPLDVGLDALVFAILCLVVGPHWAFAPSVIAEVVPGLDLAPTWVVAVTHQRRMLVLSTTHDPLSTYSSDI